MPKVPWHFFDYLLFKKSWHDNMTSHDNIIKKKIIQFIFKLQAI